MNWYNTRAKRLFIIDVALYLEMGDLDIGICMLIHFFCCYS